VHLLGSYLANLIHQRAMLAAAVDARKQRKDIQFGFMPAGHGE
jgi:hypothetical protein